MKLKALIDEYKQMVSICNNVDYSDKNSVRNNNKAVDKMYNIVQTINTDFGKDGVAEFTKLIDETENEINLCASIQMLEKMTVDKITEEKALRIIEQEAKQSIGMQYWLRDYRNHKTYTNGNKTTRNSNN